MNFVVRHGLTGYPLQFMEQPGLRVLDLSHNLAALTSIPVSRQLLISKKGFKLRPEMVLEDIRQQFLLTFHSDKQGNVKEFLSIYLYDIELHSLPDQTFQEKPLLVLSDYHHPQTIEKTVSLAEWIGDRNFKAKLEELEELNPGIYQYQQQLLAAIRQFEARMPQEKARLDLFMELLTTCAGQNNSHDTLMRHLFNCLSQCKSLAENLNSRKSLSFLKNQQTYIEYQAVYESLRQKQLSAGYEAKCLADLYYDEETIRQFIEKIKREESNLKSKNILEPYQYFKERLKAERNDCFNKRIIGLRKKYDQLQKVASQTEHALKDHTLKQEYELLFARITKYLMDQQDTSFQLTNLPPVKAATVIRNTIRQQDLTELQKLYVQNKKAIHQTFEVTSQLRSQIGQYHNQIIEYQRKLDKNQREYSSLLNCKSAKDSFNKIQGQLLRRKEFYTRLQESLTELRKMSFEQKQQRKRFISNIPNPHLRNKKLNRILLSQQTPTIVMTDHEMDEELVKIDITAHERSQEKETQSTDRLYQGIKEETVRKLMTEMADLHKLIERQFEKKEDKENDDSSRINNLQELVVKASRSGMNLFALKWQQHSKQNSALKCSLQSQLSRSAQLVGRLQKMTSQNQSQQKQSQRLRQDLHKKRTSIELYQEKLSSLQSMHSTCAQKLASFEKENGQLKDRLNRFQQLQRVRKQQQLQLKLQRDELAHDYEQIRQQLIQAKQDLSQLQPQIKDKSLQCNNLLEELELKAQECQQLDVIMKKLIAEVDKIKREKANDLQRLGKQIAGLEQQLDLAHNANIVMKTQLENCKVPLQESLQTAAETVRDQLQQKGTDRIQESLYLQNQQLKQSCAQLQRQLKAIITKQQQDVAIMVSTLNPEILPSSLIEGRVYIFLPYLPGVYIPALREQAHLYRLSLSEGFSEKQRQLLQECGLVVLGRVKKISCEGEVQVCEIVCMLGFEQQDMRLRDYS